MAGRRVNPPGVVAAVLPPELIREYGHASLELIDANVCGYQPFFSSAEAAEGWLAGHPGGRVFTPEEMFETSIFTYYRDCQWDAGWKRTGRLTPVLTQSRREFNTWQPCARTSRSSGPWTKSGP
ncbi:MAG: hypothetical protein GEU83_10915 [Pseudonocardiaceae bacterium]|nr:hypothetical protein [Pseudonocardiaceae bacterium]